MSKALWAVLIVVTLASVSLAQTYSQVQPHACLLADYNCNGNPLVDPSDSGAAYSFGGGNQGIVEGGYFSVATHEGTFNGQVSSVIEQAPRLQNGNHGPFEFEFSLTNGHTGTVSGQISVMQVCRRYCYPYAVVESATVVIQ